MTLSDCTGFQWTPLDPIRIHILIRYASWDSNLVLGSAETLWMCTRQVVDRVSCTTAPFHSMDLG
eukprot:412443-Pyramimonas_sp.AAC.1